MKKTDRVFLSLSIRIIVIVAIAFLIGVFLVTDIASFIKGLIFGTVFAILKLKLMENTFNKAVQKPEHKANSYAKLHYFIRYTLTLLVLIIGVLEPSISLLGVVIPQVAMKLSAYWYGYSQEPTPIDGSVEFLEWEDDEEKSDFW